MAAKVHTDLRCFHCGLPVVNTKISFTTAEGDEHHFCCSGCRTVYELLNENNLCNYYELNQHPAAGPTLSFRKDKYEFLDNAEIASKLISFRDNDNSHVLLYLPVMHCSSCLWLLENLNKINDGIISVRVNFNRKEALVIFNHHYTTLRQVVETFAGAGYEPHLSLGETDENATLKTDRKRWYKIGVAGFCFGNIMMMSAADYLALNNTIDPIIRHFFTIASVLLSLPVLFYAASEFFVTAVKGLKNRFLSIDLPVALALVITFTKSIWDIVTGTGTGYLDSMTGIVFFMLIGRWLQSRTYRSIAFNRDYKSFFPIAVNVVRDGKICSEPVEQIKVNDIIQLHAEEILPVDAILSKGRAVIDYSFVSGESTPVEIKPGEIIYAGGKQTGGLLELLVIREVSQSYLTGLWNNPSMSKAKPAFQNAYDRIAQYFTYAVLILGILAGTYWYLQGDTIKMWNALTTVLIVACPCALLLSQNFTNGNILRHFSQRGFYLRAPEVIDDIAATEHIVLDKTGTITRTGEARIHYSGKVLTNEYKAQLASLLCQSGHPNAKAVVKYLQIEYPIPASNFKEHPGKGIEGWINEKHIKIGSAEFTGFNETDAQKGSKLTVSIDNMPAGEFTISNAYRMGISHMIKDLKREHSLSLISGDNNSELKNIQTLMGPESDIQFNMGPVKKMQYIASLQHDHKLNVMMVGDGLNDAGALKQSNTGIAVADAGNTFTPACDAVIEASQLAQLNRFIQFASGGRRIILLTFALSAIYNLAGLWFAVRGVLSPVVAALLMPCSSITIIALTYGLTQLAAKKILKPITRYI